MVKDSGHNGEQAENIPVQGMCHTVQTCH